MHYATMARRHDDLYIEREEGVGCRDGGKLGALDSIHRSISTSKAAVRRLGVQPALQLYDKLGYEH